MNLLSAVPKRQPLFDSEVLRPAKLACCVRRSPAAFLLLSALSAFAQSAPETVRPKVEARPLFDLIMQSGLSVFVIWAALLAGAAIVAVISAQSFLASQSESISQKKLSRQLARLIEGGRHQEAWDIAEKSPSHLGRILAAALENLGRGRLCFTAAITQRSAREALALRTRSSHLLLVAVAAPLLGLLGALLTLSQSLEKNGRVAGNFPLIPAIADAIPALAFGIFVSVIALIAYHFLRNVTGAAILAVEESVSRLVESIPVEEFQGVKIGREPEADAKSPSEHRDARAQKVSLALTTNCPRCNAPIAPGVTPCPSCHSRLEWTG